MIRFSLFNNKLDNVPKPMEMDAETFCGTFTQTPDVGPKDGDAWSPGIYAAGATRSKKDVQHAQVLAFDVDRDEDNIEGASIATRDGVIAYLEGLNISYALHETYSASKVYSLGLTKFRVFVPVASLLTPDEYRSALAAFGLPAFTDASKVGPESLFYMPRRNPEYPDARYFSKVRSDRPLYVPVQKSAPISGGLFSKLSKLDPYEQVRTATEKQPALNAAAYSVGLSGKYHTHTPEFALEAEWPKFEAALRANKVSKPVEDWSAAKAFVLRGLSEGMAKHVPPAVANVQAPLHLRNDAATALLAQKRKCAKGGVAAAEMAGFRLATYIPDVYPTPEEVSRELLLAALAKNNQVSAHDFEQAFMRGLEEYRNLPDWETRLQRKDDGKPFGSAANAHMVLDNHPDMAGVLALDIRTQRILLRAAPPWDHDETSFPCELNVNFSGHRITQWVQSVLNTSFNGTHEVVGALDEVASRVQVDPVLEYYEGLTWDGVPRLDTWLKDYVARDDQDPAYLALIGSKWMIGAVARCFEPGCKMDNLLVLSGGQDQNKSTVFYTLAAPDSSYFSDTLESRDAELIKQMARYSIIEMAEMDQQNSYTIERMKAFITSRGSSVRTAYARKETDFPRRCVLAGTTNKDEGFLKDDENRRYWICAARVADIVGLKSVRDQLWAEAVVRYRAGELWYMTGDEKGMVRAANLEHVEEESFEELLVAFLDAPVAVDRRKPVVMLANAVKEDGVAYVYEGQFGPDNKATFWTSTQLTDLMCEDNGKLSKRLARVLKRRGWENKMKKIKGDMVRVWVRKGT